MKRAVLSAICLIVLVYSLTASQSWAQEPQNEFSYSVYLPMVGKSITRGPSPPIGVYPPVPPRPILRPPHQQRCNSIAQAAASRLAKKFAEILTSSNGIEEMRRLINEETKVEIIAPPKPDGPYRDRIQLNKVTPTDEFEVQFKGKKNPLSFSYSIIEDFRVEGEVILKDIALQLGIPDKIELNTLGGSLTYRVNSGWLNVKNVDKNGPPVANITNIVPTTIDNTCTIRASIQATNEAIELAQAGEGPNSNRLRAYVAGGIGVLDLKAAVSYKFSIGGARCPSPPPVSFDISSKLKLDTLDFYSLDNTHRGIFVHPVYPFGDVSVTCLLGESRINEFKVMTESMVPTGYAYFWFAGGQPLPYHLVTKEPASTIGIVIRPGENVGRDLLGSLWGGRCAVPGACRVTYSLTDIWWIVPGWTLDDSLGRTVTCRF